LEIARNLLRKGFSKEEIAELTGINPDELSGKTAVTGNHVVENEDTRAG
jgi:hypothetical protein